MEPHRGDQSISNSSQYVFLQRGGAELGVGNSTIGQSPSFGSLNRGPHGGNNSESCMMANRIANPSSMEQTVVNARHMVQPIIKNTISQTSSSSLTQKLNLAPCQDLAPYGAYISESTSSAPFTGVNLTSLSNSHIRKITYPSCIASQPLLHSPRSPLEVSSATSTLSMMPATRTQRSNHCYHLPYSGNPERERRELQQPDEQYMLRQAALRVSREQATLTAVDADAFAPQLQKDGAFVFMNPMQSCDPTGLHHVSLPPESRLWRPNPVARGDREEEPLPFNPPVLDNPLYDPDGRQFYPSIGVEGHKGFFRGEDDEWTCYRRNYFAMTCSWGAANDTGMEITPHGTYHVFDKDFQSYRQVTAFTMNITARVFDDPLKPIALVQHTPKRDKGPINTPTYIPLGPTSLWQLLYGASRFSPGSIAQGVGQPSQTTHFERLQFKKATANNGKRRAAQQHYEVEVSLCAGVKDSSGSTHYIRIASRKSHRIVVRGRSPGHYHKDRMIEKEDKRFCSGRGIHQGAIQHQFDTLRSFDRFPFTDTSGTYVSILSQPQFLPKPLVNAQEEVSESTEDDNDDQLSNTRAASPKTIESEDDVDGYQFFPAPVSYDHTTAKDSSKLPSPRVSVNTCHTENIPRDQAGFAEKSNLSLFGTDTLDQYSRSNNSEGEGLQPCHTSALANPLRSGYTDMDNSVIADFGLQPPMPTVG